LADIHEQTKHLREAIDVLQQQGAERFVFLGDVFETGKHIKKTKHAPISSQELLEVVAATHAAVKSGREKGRVVALAEVR